MNPASVIAGVEARADARFARERKSYFARALVIAGSPARTDT
jgi:hypothetical protein